MNVLVLLSSSSSPHQRETPPVSYAKITQLYRPVSRALSFAPLAMHLCLHHSHTAMVRALYSCDLERQALHLTLLQEHFGYARTFAPLGWVLELVDQTPCLKSFGTLILNVVNQWFSTWGNFCPQETSDHICRHFWFSQKEGVWDNSI